MLHCRSKPRDKINLRQRPHSNRKTGGPPLGRQQKGRCLDIGKIIHRDNFNVGPGSFLKGAQHIAANPSKSVDSNSQSHDISPQSKTKIGQRLMIKPPINSRINSQTTSSLA